MSKITVETIQGKPYTVVWRDINTDEDIASGFVEGKFEKIASDGVCKYLVVHDEDIAATALPALPRHPKPEDAPLLYRYASEGIFVWISVMREQGFQDGCTVWEGESISLLNMLHCSDITSETLYGFLSNERVEIAITDEAHNG